MCLQTVLDSILLFGPLKPKYAPSDDGVSCARQFCFLEQLLLVHGRWSYLRITNMVAFFFYKNLLFGLTIFFYNIFCLFSGQILYDGAAWLILPSHACADKCLESKSP